MSRAASMPRTKLLIALAAVAVLSGCASANLEQSLSDTNTTTKSFTDGQLSLARDAKERDALRSRLGKRRRDDAVDHRRIGRVGLGNGVGDEQARAGAERLVKHDRLGDRLRRIEPQLRL